MPVNVPANAGSAVGLGLPAVPYSAGAIPAVWTGPAFRIWTPCVRLPESVRLRTLSAPASTSPIYILYIIFTFFGIESSGAAENVICRGGNSAGIGNTVHCSGHIYVNVCTDQQR
jgi:hypothetical protein